MNELIVVAFDDLDDARQAMQSLRALEREGRIHFEDTAIVERDSEGTTHVRNELSGTTEAGAVVGAVLGGILGFALPPVGIAVGAALGAGLGASFDTGVSSGFVDDVKKTLEPGRSALFLVVKDANADALFAALRQFHGDVVQTTLPVEPEPEPGRP